MTLVVLGATMPVIGARHAAWTPTTAWAWVPTLLAVALAAVAAVLGPRLAVRRSDHRSAAGVVVGALVAHTIVGGVSLVHTPLDRAGLVVFGVVAVALALCAPFRGGRAPTAGSSVIGAAGRIR